jgi:hypothetical protein
MVEVAFFVTGLETLQILGVEMSRGGSTESNVRSFEAFLTIYLSIQGDFESCADILTTSY